MYSGQPRKNLNSGRHGNNYRSRGKISSSVYVHAYSKHVVRPHNKSQQGNCPHGINYTKCWKDQNVYLGVTKKSKKMLVQNRIPPSSRVKKRGIKISIGK